MIVACVAMELETAIRTTIGHLAEPAGFPVEHKLVFTSIQDPPVD